MDGRILKRAGTLTALDVDRVRRDAHEALGGVLVRGARSVTR